MWPSRTSAPIARPSGARATARALEAAGRIEEAREHYETAVAQDLSHFANKQVAERKRAKFQKKLNALSALTAP
jgi:hypothetical protein